jgi:hypothetical protein
MANFAALEARSTAAVFRHLANTQVQLLDRQVPAIFDSAYEVAAVGTLGMASTRPVLTLAFSSVPPQILNWLLYCTEPFDPVDVQVTVGGVVYTITSVEPDGTGITLLILERTA